MGNTNTVKGKIEYIISSTEVNKDNVTQVRQEPIVQEMERSLSQQVLGIAFH